VKHVDVQVVTENVEIFFDGKRRKKRLGSNEFFSLGYER